jgi:hypothetical protein
MKDSDFLKDGKTLLKKIAKQRDWLLCHNKSRVSASFASQEIKNLQYAISTIHDAKSMKNYLVRKNEFLKILISSKNKSYHKELNQLIESELPNY